MRRAHLATLLGCVLALAGCGSDTDEGWAAPTLDQKAFETDVYPVLIRDCGFHTCHGSTDRFFQVWGPGRARLDYDASTAFSKVTQQELTNSYQAASSMVDPKNPTRSPLLRKPLALAAGGAGHLGTDKFGRNVYRTVDDLGYLALSRWVFSVERQ